jgi:hypothetical protein
VTAPVHRLSRNTEPPFLAVICQWKTNTSAALIKAAARIMAMDVLPGFMMTTDEVRYAWSGERNLPHNENMWMQLLIVQDVAKASNRPDDRQPVAVIQFILEASDIGIHNIWCRLKGFTPDTFQDSCA